MSKPLRALSVLEARVVAVLVEKQHTVPDSYPLSLNALVLGCNQKTAREPVLQVSDADVLSALDELKSLHLVFEVSGSRVTRYEHNLGRVLAVPGQSVALLTTLVLRGPQTAAELRAHSERLHRFADVSSVEGFLDELSERDPPLVLRLARAPGAREARWTHLLGGSAQASSMAVSQAGDGSGLSRGDASGADAPLPGADDAGWAEEVRRLKLRQDELEQEVHRLRVGLQALSARLGE